MQTLFAHLVFSLCERVCVCLWGCLSAALEPLLEQSLAGSCLECSSHVFSFFVVVFFFFFFVYRQRLHTHGNEGLAATASSLFRVLLVANRSAFICLPRRFPAPTKSRRARW